jgi:acetylornithine/succinyldiaminopimelate/putrescine aminotransferase
MFPALAAGARGLGLIQGLALTPEFIPRGGEIVNLLFDAGILANFAGGLVLRFLPPLVISREEIDELLAALARIFAELVD